MEKQFASRKKISDSEVKSNAERFKAAYNTLDYSLRLQYNFKTNMSFSDLIRRCASLNSIIHKYEDNLLDYARLRNAIVHSKNDEVIAEPHIEVVEVLERIADLISTPPAAVNVVCRKDVVTIGYDATVRKTIELISQTGYSNLPVYKEGTLVGVANGRRILDSVGVQLSNGADLISWMENTDIETVVRQETHINHFAVADINLTIEEALNMFNANRKLLCILITENGKFSERPAGIMTNADVIDMYKVIDEYE